MSNQNPRDQINKASWTLVENIQDTLAINVSLAARDPSTKLEPEALRRLLRVVAASVEEGYHKGLRGFSKTVESALLTEALPELVPTKKKRS